MTPRKHHDRRIPSTWIASGVRSVTLVEKKRSFAACFVTAVDAATGFKPILANVQLQLASYWTANELGRSIDKPRNLTKSMTVE